MAHAVVLVLGDLGRSPRIQYHASSLSHIPKIAIVTQIGYGGEQIMFPDHPTVIENRFSPWEFNFFRRVALLHAVAKGLGILFKIFFTLSMLRPYDVIIIQNPPCLPAVLAASIMSLFNGSTIIIDWHNLGFAMFEERLGRDHLLVKMAFQLERAICRLAHNHICVSEALKEWLAEHFGIQATVLYDRPARLFVKQTPSVRQRHGLLSRLGYTDATLFPSFNCVAIKSTLLNKVAADDSEYGSTCQTKLRNADNDAERRGVGDFQLREDGTKMIVSATSWTADEDFSILLDALQKLNEILASRSIATEDCCASYKKYTPDRLLVVVTGKGPLKAAFEASVVDLSARGLLQFVAVKTAWLSANDYSLLLRCADLGICLHTSTSGLDLPMKVLDMFGSGLPVCAINFPTLSELVKNGENGLIFETSEQLTAQLLLLLYPHINSTIKGGSSCNPIIQSSGLGRVKHFHETGEHLQNKVKNEEIIPSTVVGINLQILREGAEKISSWDDNWNLVLGPEVSKWLK